MRLCLKRASGWRGVGCFWGAWMTNDETLPGPVEMRRSPGDFDPLAPPHIKRLAPMWNSPN